MLKYFLSTILYLVAKSLFASIHNADERFVSHVPCHVFAEPREGSGTRGIDLAAFPQTLIFTIISLLGLLSCDVNILQQKIVTDNFSFAKKSY